MKPFNQKKTTRLDILLTQSQNDQLQAEFSSSNYKVFSEFVRARLMEEPIVKRYRNQSQEEINQELIALKNEMREFNSLGVVDEASLAKLIASFDNTLIKIYEKCGLVGKGLPE